MRSDRLTCVGTSRFLTLLAAVFLCLSLVSCGSHQGGTQAPVKTGAVSFTVEWEPPPEGTVIGGAAPLSLKPMAPAIDVCTDYGIDTVTMRVLKGTDTLSTQAFPCGNHAGTISEVAAGENLVLAIVGSIGGITHWNGESELFNLAAGEMHDAGKITMIYTGTDHTAPSVSTVNPADHTVNVPETGDIRIRFSERMAANTVIDIEAVQVAPEGGAPVSGSLSYNSSDNTSLFHPSTSLQSGTKYSVSVSSSVQDMAGNAMGAPYSSEFHTRFRGQWGIPAEIENAQGGSGNCGSPYIDVSLHGNGDVFAVWQETIGNPIFVYASRYINAENRWETPRNISRLGDQYSCMARVSTDPAGNAIALWKVLGGRLVARRYSSGNWGDPATIDDNQGNSDLPVMAIDNVGNARASYVASDIAGKEEIYIASYSVAADYWNRPYSGSAGSNCLGEITINKFAYLYDDYGPKDMIVYSCDNVIYHRDYPLIQIGMGDPYYSDNEGVYLTAKGNKAVVVWDNTDGVWSSFYDGSTNTWAGPTKIDSHRGNPSVAMNANGDIVAVWGEQYGDVYASQATFTGKQWSSPVILSAIGLYGMGNTKAGIDKDGNGLAIWEQPVDYGIYSILSKRYDSVSKTWDTASDNVSKNNQIPDSNAYYPCFSMTDDGNAVAAYLLHDDPLGSTQANVHVNFWYK